jgi:hypothetical protein
VVSRRAPITFETVKRIGLTLAGVELGTSFGNPALKANGRLLACIASNKSAEPDSLCLSLSIRERDELVLSDPGVYYLTPHYVPGPYLVARLTTIHEDALKDLLSMSLRYCLSRPAGKTRTRPRKRAKTK